MSSLQKLLVVELNGGFWLTNRKMVTYTQQKDTLSYLYIKRKVAEGGVSISLLDV